MPVCYCHILMQWFCYTIYPQVIAVSPVGPSEPSRVERAVTLQGVPVGEGIKDGPEDVRVEHGGPDSIMVHWTIPQV